MYQKGFAHLSLIALVLVLGGGIFLGSQLIQQNQNLRSEASGEANETSTPELQPDLMWPMLKIISNECVGQTPVVTLGWTHFDGAKSYLVFRDDQQIGTTSYPEIQFTDTGVGNQTIYSYAVQAQESPHGEATSNKITVKSMNCPNP